MILESTIVALTKCEDEQQSECNSAVDWTWEHKHVSNYHNILILNLLVFCCILFQIIVDILDSETILQLHTVLCEAFTSIILLLNAVSSHERGKSHNSSSSSNISWTPASAHPIVAASIRVLGAWLAEETLMLTEGLYELLPFLLRFAGASSPRCVDEDLLKFLLPGLCHLSAEDKARKLLLGEGLVEVLGSYLQDLALLVAEEPESRYVAVRASMCMYIRVDVCFIVQVKYDGCEEIWVCSEIWERGYLRGRSSKRVRKPTRKGGGWEKKNARVKK